MKRIIMMLLCLVLTAATMCAQSAADKIVGSYKVNRNGVASKVKVFKHDGGYRAQVTWVDNLKMEDGSIRLDSKNPDKNKRNTRADQIVLVDKVTYTAADKVWENGRIYDPTNGKTYKLRMWFDGDKTLKLRGYVGPFYETMEWTKE